MKLETAEKYSLWCSGLYVLMWLLSYPLFVIFVVAMSQLDAGEAYRRFSNLTGLFLTVAYGYLFFLIVIAALAIFFFFTSIVLRVKNGSQLFNLRFAVNLLLVIFPLKYLLFDFKYLISDIIGGF